jgi:serine/threonine-protein kinase
MLTDAVGFSARMSVDEVLTLQLIRRDQQLMTTLCNAHEGQVLKSTGDGLLMFFASAVQAVNCGLSIQRELQNRNQGVAPDQALLHRIGIHLGDVFFHESDVMGNGVNIAERLQTEAEPGGLCISQIVYDVVKSRLSLEADYAGPLNLKNIRDPVPAYRIHPVGRAAEGTPESDPKPTIAQGAREKLAPGTRVGGRYVIQRVLGQGGFGRSYLVEDTQRFNEYSVLKEFFPTNKMGRSLQKAVDLFKREAKTLYQLDHPQVPKFLACFTQAQRLFLVQEFIDGVSYSQLLRQRRREGRGFAEAEVRDWLQPMLQVLDYLHGLNIVHRDISPDNIIFCRDRSLPVLIDFGLVNDAVSDLLHRTSTEDASGTALEDSKPATMVGKFGYSPPEQIHLGQCFPCSDLYALGVTAIVFLTGKYPRDLIDRDSLEWHWQTYASPSPKLAAILNRLIRQKPKERFQSARQVLDALVGAGLTQAGQGTLSAPSSPVVIPKSSQTAFPINLPDTVLAAGPSILMDEAFLDLCRQELTRCIGPMASIVLEEAIEQNPEASAAELVRIIAAQLSDGEQATAFVSRITTTSTLFEGDTSTFGAEISSQIDATSPNLAVAPASSDLKTASPLTPDFIRQCQQALTRCIGPMAAIVLEDTLDEYPNLSPQDLVDRLASEIPNPQQASEFRQQLL